MKYQTYGGTVVEAQSITDFFFDKITTTKCVILADGSKVVQPKTHGYIPHIGDFLVQALPPATCLRNGREYQEPTVDAAIIPQSDFSNLYTPLPPKPETIVEPVPILENLADVLSDRGFTPLLELYVKSTSTEVVEVEPETPSDSPVEITEAPVPEITETVEPAPENITAVVEPPEQTQE